MIRRIAFGFLFSVFSLLALQVTFTQDQENSADKPTQEEMKAHRENFLETSRKLNALEEDFQKAKDAGDAENLKKLEAQKKELEKKQRESYDVLKSTGIERRELRKSRAREMNKELRKMRTKISEDESEKEKEEASDETEASGDSSDLPNP